MDHIDFNCIFCAIAAGRAPAARVYESDGALAFMDIHPITEGHVLLIPKKHSRNLFDIDDSSAAAVMHAARILGRALRVTFKADGLNLFQSSERAAGQDVFHFHFHLLPRFLGDGLLSTSGGSRAMGMRARGNPTREELEQTATRIRAEVARAQAEAGAPAEAGEPPAVG